MYPRVLSFALDEIQWYYKETQFCECNDPPHWPSDTHSESYRRMRENLQEASQQVGGRTPSFDFDLWYALAKHFAPRVMGRYLAVLWDNDLIHGLKWQRRWPEEGRWFSPKARSTPPSNAPSWSWASREGLVLFPSPGMDLSQRPKRSAQINIFQGSRASTTSLRVSTHMVTSTLVSYASTHQWTKR